MGTKLKKHPAQTKLIPEYEATTRSHHVCKNHNHKVVLLGHNCQFFVAVVQGPPGDNTLVTFTANNYDDGTGWHLNAWQNGELVSTCTLPDLGEGSLV